MDQPNKFGSPKDEERRAMKIFQETSISPPVLALPDAEGHYTFDIDAYDVQVGCMVLLEQPDKTEKLVRYWYKFLTKADKAYDTTKKECLTIVRAIILLQSYIKGYRFTIRTDHNWVRRVLNLPDASGRLATWRLRLIEFEFAVLHRAGVKH